MILGYWYVYKITAGKEPAEETVTEAGRDESRQSLERDCRPGVQKSAASAADRLRNLQKPHDPHHHSLRLLLFHLCAQEPGFHDGLFAGYQHRHRDRRLRLNLDRHTDGQTQFLLDFSYPGRGAFASARFFGGTAWGFTIIFCVASFLANIAGSMNTALFSDTVIYGEWKTGKNIRAFTMALLNFPIKMAVLIRSAVVTLGWWRSVSSPTPLLRRAWSAESAPS